MYNTVLRYCPWHLEFELKEKALCMQNCRKGRFWKCERLVSQTVMYPPTICLGQATPLLVWGSLAYQCAFVSLNSDVVEIWKRMSNIFIFPKMLDQWGFPKGSTVSFDEGTAQVTESFFLATSKYPPPSVVTSHQA